MVRHDRPRAYSYVRMSTDIQLKGDSLRRQLDASLAYASVNGLDLVEAETLRDLGVSAFSLATRVPDTTSRTLGRRRERWSSATAQS